MAEKSLCMVVGLGNPGDAYAKTRHNAGFLTVDAVARRYGIRFTRSKFDALYGLGSVEGRAVVLAKPMAFMNRSGPPVQQLAHYYRIADERIVVVHDDIDLVLGRLQIKEKGGDGGHRGVRSLMDALGGGAFPRLRIGIGRPETHAAVTDHVLGGFSGDELQLMDRIIAVAQDAVVAVLCKGTTAAMNRFNDKRTQLVN